MILYIFWEVLKKIKEPFFAAHMNLERSLHYLPKGRRNKSRERVEAWVVWHPGSKQGRIWALQRVRTCRGVKNRMDLNKKPIFLAGDFATEEMCSFQDRSDAIQTPKMDSLECNQSNFSRRFKMKVNNIKITFFVFYTKSKGPKRVIKYAQKTQKGIRNSI